MVNFAVPNVTIPFDMLTNEQREAIYLIMTGDGFRNPLKEKIIKAREIVVNEINLVSNIQIHPYSQTLLTEQQITLVKYHLNIIVFWLNALELHSDKLSGTESEYVGDMMQRLSVAGLYTKTMKSITGMDNEQYSLIFGSLTSLGESVINNLSKLTFCEGSSNFCEIDTNNSGVEGIAHAIEVYPVTVDSMNQCLFPKIIERLKNLIDLDEENFCKARRIIERYSYGTKIIESLENDPIFGEAIKNVFATPQLKEALIAIRDSQQNLELATADEEQFTDKFFPEFNIDAELTNCLVEDQLIHYGIQGITGAGGGVGATGSPGIPGPVGDCNCGGGGGGGAGDCDCSQGGDAVGACCVCDGYCVHATEFQCQHYGGVFYGVGSDCSLVPCTPTGQCAFDTDCGLGEICCGSQCLVECPLGGCPPCPTCLAGYTQCGTQCCQDSDLVLGIDGQVCCGDVCVAPCVDETTGEHSCPDCQGICCPPFTSCCGGDGCCPDGSCCQSECCQAGTQNTDCDNGGECQCCPIGTDFTSKCCSGECCSQDSATGVWQTCCGAAGCCDPAQCCNGICCPEGEVCCLDDFGVYECIPFGNQCNCPDGSYECDELGEGGLLCCGDEQSCCTKADGTKYCCNGECCNDSCCIGKCMDIGNGPQCCGRLEGYDYGGGSDPRCTACQHAGGDTYMCFCLEDNDDFDLDCSTCPHCPCATDNFRPECPLMGGYEYGVNCFCPLGMEFDFWNCECDCPGGNQPCESPWSDTGDANENDPCWDVGGYCCDSNTPDCCGHIGGAPNCYTAGPLSEHCCEVGEGGGVGPGVGNIGCDEDSGNWLCEYEQTCCGGWRWNGPSSFFPDTWTTIGNCCYEDFPQCCQLPNAELYNENTGELIWRGIYSCCQEDSYCCEPDESNSDVCRFCPCDQIELSASDPDGGDDIAVCCPPGNNKACVEENGDVHCWHTDEMPYAGCCSSEHTNDIVWGEFGCCGTYNISENWINWNNNSPIIRLWYETGDTPKGNDGCPCGCEHSVGGGGVYDHNDEIGDSSCRRGCPKVQAGVGIGNAIIDYRCNPSTTYPDGHACECRGFDETKDCGQDGGAVPFPKCCCTDHGGKYNGLASQHILWCRGGVLPHPYSCGLGDQPGEIWCLDCPDDENPECDVCCYNGIGHNCGVMSIDDVQCNHVCYGMIGSEGIYPCGDDAGIPSPTKGTCSHGCDNGMPTCLGDGRPRLDGTPCDSECVECGEVALASYNPPIYGSCWFDNNCTSFESMDDGIRMNVGDNKKLLKSPHDMCKELGGVWNEKTCTHFIPKEIRDISATQTQTITEKEKIKLNFLERGGNNLLKQYPDKTIDEIIGAKKKYTPVLDSTGNVIKTKIELVFDSGPTGVQSELSTPTTVTQTITNYPIQFQIVNFVAEEKLKTEIRDPGTSEKDSKSKISKAELKEEKELGEAGAEIVDAEVITISGSLTAAITNDGTIGEGLLISFVSGSNIKLSTNESNNIIKISVDDIYLHELIDVSDDEPAFGDVLQWKLKSGGSTGHWTPVSPNVGVTGATGPIGGSDKQILFNQGGAASGSDNLKYNYDTNTVQINAGVEFGSGFTFSGTANMQNQPVVQAQLKNYSETVYNHGNVTGTPLLIDVRQGNVQTLTKAITDGGLLSCSILNAPTGSVSMTLIITNGGTNDGITLPAAIWAGGNVPSYSAIGTDIVTFNTLDGGTSWYGFVGGLGFTG